MCLPNVYTHIERKSYMQIYIFKAKNTSRLNVHLRFNLCLRKANKIAYSSASLSLSRALALAYSVFCFLFICLDMIAVVIIFFFGFSIVLQRIKESKSCFEYPFSWLVPIILYSLCVCFPDGFL